MAANADDHAFDLPKLRVSFGFENDTRFLTTEDNVAGTFTPSPTSPPHEGMGCASDQVLLEFFDVKFCPYQPLDCDAIFAAISKKHASPSLPTPPSSRILLCRLSHGSGEAHPCEVINMIRDDDDGAAGCCCTWTRDPVTGDPYICIGGRDAKVKIYDPVDGRLVECFVGHGGDVNDLATSPIDPSIIASASDDTSVRIWSIDPVHEQQPCVCILAGEGHSWSLLSLAFHANGRYLLSGGHDQVINLWTIPDLPTKPVTAPLQVYYPHFSTAAIHSGIVDCVAFYGDMILSRACHDNVIVLWRIEGFSSDGPLPAQNLAPTPQHVLPPSGEDTGRLTRSAFVPTTSPLCPVQYTRLLEFHTPNCGPQFFMRFKLHHVPDQNPVLAFCNAAGNIFFWDLRRLEAYHDFVMTSSDPAMERGGSLQLPSWQKVVVPRHRPDASIKTRSIGSDRESTVASAKGSNHTGEPGFSQETIEAWTSRYGMEDAHEPLRAHKSESSSANFVGRQAAWSPGGEWCVIVGSSNTALVLQRWGKKPAPKHSKNV